MKLVDDAKRAWRWVSVQCMAVAGMVQAVWVSLPDDLHQALSKYAAGISIALLVLGILGRLVKQEGAPTDPGKPDAP